MRQDPTNNDWLFGAMVIVGGVLAVWKVLDIAWWTVRQLLAAVIICALLNGCTALEHNRVMLGFTWAWTKAAREERAARAEEKAWEKSRTSRTNQTSQTAAAAGFDLLAMMNGPDRTGGVWDFNRGLRGRSNIAWDVRAPLIPGAMTMAAVTPNYRTNFPPLQLPGIGDAWAWNVEQSTNLKTWVVVLSNQQTGPIWTLPNPQSASAFWRARRL